MNVFAIIGAIVVPIAVFFSYTQDWLSKNVHPGNWDKEVSAAWDSARNLRPCIGAHDAACKYPLPSEVKRRAEAGR